MVNSELLECGIQLKDPGIPLVIGIQNLSSAKKNPESSTWDPKSTVWNLEFKIVFPNIGEIALILQVK